MKRRWQDKDREHPGEPDLRPAGEVVLNIENSLEDRIELLRRRLGKPPKRSPAGTRKKSISVH